MNRCELSPASIVFRRDGVAKAEVCPTGQAEAVVSYLGYPLVCVASHVAVGIVGVFDLVLHTVLELGAYVQAVGEYGMVVGRLQPVAVVNHEQVFDLPVRDEVARCALRLIGV